MTAWIVLAATLTATTPQPTPAAPPPAAPSDWRDEVESRCAQVRYQRNLPARPVGNTLVVLAAEPGAAENARPLAQRLAFDGFTVIVPDLPAAGGEPALRAVKAALACEVMQSARAYDGMLFVGVGRGATIILDGGPTGEAWGIGGSPQWAFPTLLGALLLDPLPDPAPHPYSSASAARTLILLAGDPRCSDPKFAMDLGRLAGSDAVAVRRARALHAIGTDVLEVPHATHDDFADTSACGGLRAAAPVAGLVDGFLDFCRTNRDGRDAWPVPPAGVAVRAHWGPGASTAVARPKGRWHFDLDLGAGAAIGANATRAVGELRPQLLRYDEDRLAGVAGGLYLEGLAAGAGRNEAGGGALLSVPLGPLHGNLRLDPSVGALAGAHGLAADGALLLAVRVPVQSTHWMVTNGVQLEERRSLSDSHDVATVATLQLSFADGPICAVLPFYKIPE